MILLLAACLSPTQAPTELPGPLVPWSETVVLGPMQPSDVFFDTLGAISLSISPVAMQQLRVQPREYVEATFQWEDRVFAGVGVRLKGENSFLPVDEKPSWKVKLDWTIDQELFGLTDLTFNNLRSDPSMMAESIAYWVYREAGIPAARSGHVQIEVNGQPYGLYSNIETASARMLRPWYEGEVDRMWEVHDCDFRTELLSGFGIEVGPDDRAPILGVTEGLSNDDLSMVAQHMDLDQTVRFFAVTAVVGQFDAYPYSYPGDDAHIATDPATGLLQWLPHGLDESMHSQSTNVTSVTGDVAEACFDDPTCETAYRDQVLEVLELVHTIQWVDRIETVRTEIQQAAMDDPRRPYSGADVAEAQLDVLDFAQNRRQDMAGDFN